MGFVDIISSSYAVVLYFEQNPLQLDELVYVIGQEGICEELDLAGIPYIGGPSEQGRILVAKEGEKLQQDSRVAAVVCGLDQHINYYKIQYAQLCLNQNKKCRFIATNLDQVSHLTSGQEWACGGASAGAIQGCTGRTPEVVGKPSRLVMDALAAHYGLDRSRVCMVGDRLDTDVKFGHNSGLRTILTLSGVTSLDQVLSPENEIIPEFIVDSIADFLGTK